MPFWSRMRDERAEPVNDMTFPAAEPVATHGFPPPPQSPPPPLPPRRSRRWIWWSVTVLIVFTLLWLVFTAPLSRAFEPLQQPTLVLLSAEGSPIARRGAVKEAPVDVAKLPDHVGDAFTSIEDRRFHTHWGVDPRAIGRAAWRNFQAGGVVEGGSTITQQLAKTAFLSSDRKMGRKFQEMLIAFWLEAWLTKDDILSRYLSSIYFGDGVYGLRAASQHYFGRAPERLTLAQSAMLAGMVKAPSRLAPTKNLSGARARARIVLQEMADEGKITQRQARNAPPAKVSVRRRKLPTGTYFADWIGPVAQEAFESDYGEIRVRTTLEADLQRIAIQAIGGAGLGKKQAALIAMRPNGEVVAMLGGRSYTDSPFNRVTQARRQPGSAFKLFVYLTALRNGYTPDSRIEDAPLTIGDWSPKNSDGRYRGSISLRQAFARSSNVGAVRLSEALGRDRVIRTARELGIRSPIAAHPSVALGTSTMTLLELTSAYAGVASGSYPVVARGLPNAEKGWRERLTTRSIPKRTVWPQMLDLLWAAANEGTGRAAALNVPTFGKTGTTQDHRDALFVGFAENLVVGVWVGNDDNSPMRGVTGGSLPARIWKDFMRRALATERGAPRTALAPPDRTVAARAPDVVEVPQDLDELSGAIEAGADVIDRAEEIVGPIDGAAAEEARRAARIIDRINETFGPGGPPDIPVVPNAPPPEEDEGF